MKSVRKFKSYYHGKSMQKATQPSQSLRNWFFIHFLVDYIFAIPLFLFPVETLTLFGWGIVDPFTTRLVASALFAIGGLSLVSRYSEILVYKHILILKIIWSLFAIVGILITAFTTVAPVFSWIALGIFLLFAMIWIYYYRMIFRT